MVLVFLLTIVAGLLVVHSKHLESRRAAVRIWSDEFERGLVSSRRNWPLE
jgi:hypothetical protein